MLQPCLFVSWHVLRGLTAWLTLQWMALAKCWGLVFNIEFVHLQFKHKRSRLSLTRDMQGMIGGWRGGGGICDAVKKIVCILNLKTETSFEYRYMYTRMHKYTYFSPSKSMLGISVNERPDLTSQFWCMKPESRLPWPTPPNHLHWSADSLATAVNNRLWSQSLCLESSGELYSRHY